MFTDNNQNLPRMNKEAVDGARDAATCARKLTQVHSHIQEVQMSLFKDSEEILPDLLSDDVRAAKERLEEKKAWVATSR
jgi:hypothetical protein